MLLLDWLHRSSLEFYNSLYFSNLNSMPATILINGKGAYGVYFNISAEQSPMYMTPREVFEVQQVNDTGIWPVLP